MYVVLQNNGIYFSKMGYIRAIFATIYSDSLDNSLDTQKPGFKSGAHQRFCKTLKYIIKYTYG